MIKVEYATFSERKQRAAYVVDKYRHLLQGSVLDVGCDQALIKEFLPSNVDYFGIDRGDNADLVVNLDEIEKLPFDNHAFDAVVCCDVLEHLEQLHHLFHELVRVSKKWTIISLPNCWVNARQPITRGKGDFSYYGLPLEPPPDRHRWFFSMTEIKTFMEKQAERCKLKIFDMHVSEKPRPWLLRFLRKIRYPVQMRYLNRYAHTLWTVLEKDKG